MVAEESAYYKYCAGLWTNVLFRKAEDSFLINHGDRRLMLSSATGPAQQGETEELSNADPLRSQKVALKLFRDVYIINLNRSGNLL